MAMSRSRILGSADGYVLAEVQVELGYRGCPHKHTHPEFLYVLGGTLRNQGRLMTSGDGYAAAAGSMHEDFEAETPSRYLSMFRL